MSIINNPDENQEEASQENQEKPLQENQEEPSQESQEEPIQENAEKVPTGNYGVDTNPWREPMSLITWGFFLTCFTWNFLLLQYILPAIGAASLYIGFRDLRKVNDWFRAGWIMAIIKIALQLVYLMMCATPIYSISDSNMVIGSIGIILQISMLSVLRTATRQIFYNAGAKPNKDPLLALIIWTILIIICAITKIANNNWILFLPLIIFYFVKIHSLHKIGDDLGEFWEAFVKAPVKLSSMVILEGYLIVSCSLVLICCVIANHMLPIASRQVTMSESQTRTELVKKGFPNDVIKEIPDKDISMMKGAIHITNSYEDLKFNKWNQATGTSVNNTINRQHGKELGVSTIFVEMPNYFAYMVVYFKWNKSVAFWQDGFTIWGVDGMELLDGALLFHKKGIDYTAPIPRLKYNEVTTQSWFNTKQSRRIVGAVNYPFTSKKQRGFVFYRISKLKNLLCINNCLDYYHYNYPFQFPYIEPEKRIQKGSFDDNMKQAYTYFETQLGREQNK